MLVTRVLKSPALPKDVRGTQSFLSEYQEVRISPTNPMTDVFPLTPAWLSRQMSTRRCGSLLHSDFSVFAYCVRSIPLHGLLALPTHNDRWMAPKLDVYGQCVRVKVYRAQWSLGRKLSRERERHIFDGFFHVHVLLQYSG